MEMENRWHQSWREGRIGFHRSDVHPTLEDVALEQSFFPGTVFVPLAGKTVDLPWLARRGARVIAVELVDIAVKAFFAEQELAHDVERDGNLRRYQALDLDITFYQGDVFDLESTHLEGVSWVHDRASLVALPQEDRSRYGEHLSSILPGDAELLITTFEYDQEEMNGPPFSVPLAEMQGLFPDFAFEHQRTRDIVRGVSHLRERGLSVMLEHVYAGKRS